MPDTQIFELPASLDSHAAPGLLKSMLELRGADAQLDASAVRRLGGQCLQILLSALATWQAEGHRLVLQPVSADLAANLGLFGLKPDLSSAGKGEWQ